MEILKIWYQVWFHTPGAVYCRSFDTEEEAKAFSKLVKDGKVEKREEWTLKK